MAAYPLLLPTLDTPAPLKLPCGPHMNSSNICEILVPSSGSPQRVNSTSAEASTQAQQQSLRAGSVRTHIANSIDNSVVVVAIPIADILACMIR